MSVFFVFKVVTYNLVKDAYQLPDSWDALSESDIFLSRAFLTALQESSPSNISSYFLLIWVNDLLVGICVIQRVQIYYDDLFRHNKDHFLSRGLKNVVSKIVRGNALVLGNLMHTGQHGYHILTDKIEPHEFLKVLETAINELREQIKKEFNKSVRIIALKDFFEDNPIHTEKRFFEKNKFYRVEVQPNMVFDIPKTWRSSADYVQAFNKKYKRRYKTALQKRRTIDVQELDLEAIKRNEGLLFALYETVSDGARVNSFKLKPDHFYQLKKRLESSFKLYAYYLKDELVGFYTLILNGTALETYFLGYNSALQTKHQLYLNMLFDMVKFAIDHDFEHVVFARTAMEIKSSVGARPKAMSIYLKHTSSLLANPLLKFIVNYMNPKREWDQRHPFSK